ncbi:MAG: mechanosensitive ion channel [Kiritimatiellae bacterium]|nr:mechanosensitive ion channel [Kiritimatiellia bacterium]
MAMSLQISAEEQEHPLLPADISSPRATLSSFSESCEKAYDTLNRSGRKINDGNMRLKTRSNIRNIKSCLDLSQVAKFQLDNRAKESAVSLKEVLDRIELPAMRKIPDRQAMLKDDGSLLEQWTLPNTEITFTLVTEGDKKGGYQFSSDTIERAEEFYLQVKHLPYKKGSTENFAMTYLSSPGQEWLAKIVNRLPSKMRRRVNGQTVWQWIGLVLVLLGAFLIMAVTYNIGRRISRGGPEQGIFKYVLGLAFPVIAVFIPIRTIGIITNVLVISGITLHFMKFNLALIALFSSMVVVLGIGRRVGEVIVSSPRIKSQSIDAQLIRVMSRLMGVVFAIILFLQGGQHLGIPLSSLLAGAGVAGAALALSSQDVLKNIFGSIMLIFDKPFVIGERIKVKHYDGVVEEVGLRSTKLRLLNGHQAIIPNEDMAKSDIENIGRRPFIRRSSTIALALDVGSDKAKEAVAIVKEILKDHEGNKPEFPPRVWLNDFERDHLELKFLYWYHPPSYWEYTAHADKVNREILDEFKTAGIKMALPAFATYVDDDKLLHKT